MPVRLNRDSPLDSLRGEVVVEVAIPQAGIAVPALRFGSRKRMGMRMPRSFARMLDEMVEHRTEPDRGSPRQAQHQIPTYPSPQQSHRNQGRPVPRTYKRERPCTSVKSAHVTPLDDIWMHQTRRQWNRR